MLSLNSECSPFPCGALPVYKSQAPWSPSAGCSSSVEGSGESSEGCVSDCTPCQCQPSAGLGDQGSQWKNAKIFKRVLLRIYFCFFFAYIFGLALSSDALVLTRFLSPDPWDNWKGVIDMA